MTKFEKPGSRENFDYPQMTQESIGAALKDSRIKFSEFQQAYAGYCYGESTCGQRALYETGMTGIPVVNVNNNCSTGSTANFLAMQAIRAGYDCILTFGFEKMQPGSLQQYWTDRAGPFEHHAEVVAKMYGKQNAPLAPTLFGSAAVEYGKKYGIDVAEELAWVAWKNHKHSVNNPRSQFRDEYTIDQVRKSPKIAFTTTKLMCCPTSDGSAAAVLVSEDYLNNLLKNSSDEQRTYYQERAVELLDIQLMTDLEGTFTSNSCQTMIGCDMAKAAADRLYKNIGLTAKDFGVVELHDCFAANEFLTYEALGLAEKGKAVEFVRSGDATYGGRHVVNPSGGLISKGHPLGATGIAQMSELSWQLRGEAGKRQVLVDGKPPRYGLQHNIGLGGAVVVAAYKAPAIQRIKPETLPVEGKYFPKDKKPKAKSQGKSM
jgi:sterol carrier protein 2